MMNFSKDKKKLEVKDFTVSNEVFSLFYNEEYNLLITDPFPDESKIGDYYKSENYISHTDGKRNLFERIYQAVKKIALKNKIDLLFNQTKFIGSVLDIGCGTGDFLLEAKNKGWTVSGFEPNEDAKKLAANKNIIMYNSLADLADESFDAITLWHVLEHIPNLEEQILEFRRLLKPNGKLIVAVPNFRSFDAKYYKEFWAAYDVPRHLWHFSKESIEKIFSNFSFSLDDLQPMLFDSFYVSLLSEQYKTGKRNWLKAFSIGLRSNVEARRSMEYSSLIFCLTKQEM